jgi:arsenate reductase-like glutaredoxin family protein
VRPLAELRRFSERWSRALLDEEARFIARRGWPFRMSDEEIVERLLADPRLLRLPLVRNGAELSVGLTSGDPAHRQQSA